MGSNWKDVYQGKVKTAKEAVKVIKSGDRIVIGHAAGEPLHVVNTMVEMAARQQLKDVEVVQLVPLGKSLYAQPGMEKHFRLNGIFLGGTTRECVASGQGDFTPSFFYQVPDLFRTTLPVDVVLVCLSPPDENGYCSYGVSTDYTKPCKETAKVVIAQVNKNMPRTLGDCFVHISDLDMIVEYDEPIPEIPLPNIGDTEMAIGEHCASLVQDGDCLQLGIGGIPDAVLKCLGDKKDLGIHSEMVSDGVVELYEQGVVNCKKKNLNKDKMVIAFLMGTKRLYEFAHNNPAIAMMPVDYVNNPMVIGQNDNIVSINSAVQVDLMGQVCGEAMGMKQYSGVGGQVDFVRGAAFSKGGRSILAFPSTAKQGTISKIVPFLTQGSPVTTSRTDVDYIVTEHGIAKLKGQTLRERARRLINIAAPAFRDELAGEFERRFNEKF